MRRCVKAALGSWLTKNLFKSNVKTAYSPHTVGKPDKLETREFRSDHQAPPRCAPPTIGLRASL